MFTAYKVVRSISDSRFRSFMVHAAGWEKEYLLGEWVEDGHGLFVFELRAQAENYGDGIERDRAVLECVCEGPLMVPLILAAPWLRSAGEMASYWDSLLDASSAREWPRNDVMATPQGTRLFKRVKAVRRIL